MFNVIRSEESPSCLSDNGQDYRQEEVIQALRKVFHSKCYLCERDAVQDVEIEHFVPRAAGGGVTDWNNLFYSCRRCNGIKSNRHVGLLDCTDPRTDVFAEIRLRASVVISDDVLVTPTSERPSQETVNTIELLRECYNNKSTALRRISREHLMESILEKMVLFVQARLVLKNVSAIDQDKERAKGTLIAMMRDTHPFSAFWRWQYLDDPFLMQAYPEIGEGFNAVD